MCIPLIILLQWYLQVGGYIRQQVNILALKFIFWKGKKLESEDLSGFEKSQIEMW